MSSKLPISADAAKVAHMQRLFVVPQPQYTIFAAAGASTALLFLQLGNERGRQACLNDVRRRLSVGVESA
jgi:hypothetical protein